MHFRFDFKQGKEETKVTRSFLFKWQSAVHRWRVKQIAKKLPNEIGSLKYKCAVYGASSFFPCAPWNKSQNREYLKSAGEHIKYQHKLWKRAVRAEVSGGSDYLKTGADVVEAREHSGQICYKRLVVNRYKQYTQNNQNKICGEINACAVDNFFVNGCAVYVYNLNSSRVKYLVNVSA